MKKQMTVMDMGIFFAAAIIALILLTASQWYATSNAPTVSNLPSVQNGEWVVNDSPVEIGESGLSAENTVENSAVEADPATGAGVVESSAPLASNLDNETSLEASVIIEAQ